MCVCVCVCLGSAIAFGQEHSQAWKCACLCACLTYPAGQAVHYAKGDFLVFPAYLAFVVSVEARDKIKTFSIP